MGCIFWMVHVMTKIIWNTYGKSYMVFQLTSWYLTLDDLQRSNWVFSGLYLLNRAFYHMNEQIWLPGNYGSEFEQYLTGLQLDTIYNFRSPFTWTGTTNTYDFLSAKQVILRNVGTNFNLTQFISWSTFDRIGTYNDHIGLPIYKWWTYGGDRHASCYVFFWCHDKLIDIFLMPWRTLRSWRIFSQWLFHASMRVSVCVCVYAHMCICV